MPTGIPTWFNACMSVSASRLDAMYRARTLCRLARVCGVEVLVPVGVEEPLSSSVMLEGVGFSVDVVSSAAFDFNNLFSFFSFFLFLLSSFSLSLGVSETCCLRSLSDIGLDLFLELLGFFSFFFSLESSSPFSYFSFSFFDFFLPLEESEDLKSSVCSSWEHSPFDRLLRFFSWLASKLSIPSVSSAFRFLDFFSFFALFDDRPPSSVDSKADFPVLSDFMVAGSVPARACN